MPFFNIENVIKCAGVYLGGYSNYYLIKEVLKIKNYNK